MMFYKTKNCLPLLNQHSKETSWKVVFSLDQAHDSDKKNLCFQFEHNSQKEVKQYWMLILRRMIEAVLWVEEEEEVGL